MFFGETFKESSCPFTHRSLEGRSGSKSHAGTVLFSRRAASSCLKQSVYMLHKYLSNFLSVKTLKRFNSSFAYKYNISRNDESFCGYVVVFFSKGRESCHHFVPWEVYSASLFPLHVLPGFLLHLPACSMVSFSCPLLPIFSYSSLILGHPEVKLTYMFLR